MLLAFGCGPRDTGPLAILVTVCTNPGTGSDIFRVDLNAGLNAQQHLQTAAADGEVVGFPLALEVPLRSADGRLEVTVRAFDAHGVQVDQGFVAAQLARTESSRRLEVTLEREQPARLVVDPGWQLLPETVLGQTAPTAMVKVSNLGATITELLSLSAEGDLNDFTLGGDCERTALAADASCTVAVAFHPVLDGRRRLVASIGGARFELEGDGVSRHAVVLAVAGAGRVDFEGGSCPGRCRTVVPHGEFLTLRATSAPGSAFAGWSIPECPGLVPTCVLQVSRPLEVRASFEAFEFPLTVHRVGTGFAMLDLGSGPLLRCADCSLPLPRGRTVRVIPTVSTATGFNRFDGDCQGEEQAGCTLVMDQPREVTVTFGQLNYAFITSEPVDGGLRSLAQADALCQRLGPAHTSRTYRAWLSTSSVPAASRFAGARGWQSRGLRRVADTAASMLAGRLVRAIDLDEQGMLLDGVAVATGTLGDGGLGPNCSDWSSDVGDFTAGDTSLAASGFTEASLQACGSEQRLLCLGVDYRSALTPFLQLDACRRIFVTRQRFVPLDGPAAADALCAAEAGAASLPGQFLAALGTTTRLLPLLSPDAGLMRVDQERVWQPASAVNETSLNMTADGDFLGLEPVWLGTAAEASAPATALDTCADWTDGGTGRVTLAPRQGASLLTNTALQPCSSGAHLLCVEQPP